jgi:hypothetical protein
MRVRGHSRWVPTTWRGVAKQVGLGLALPALLLLLLFLTVAAAL